MGWNVKLGGQITVVRDGVDLGPPDNKTVAMLLVGLLSRGSNWSSREELAKLLYPHSEPTHRRASLRQSFFRLRRWLGPSAFEQVQDRIRLQPNCWSHDFVLATGTLAPAPMIAPGIIHPWMDSIRLEWAPQMEALQSDSVASFAQSVTQTAQIDPDVARSLLVAGAMLTEGLSVESLGVLLGMTEPKDRRDPLVFEHHELRSSLYYRLGCLKEAKDMQRRAFSLASQQRSQGRMILAGTMTLFLEIEDGQLGEAAAWVDYLQNDRHADTKSLFYCNAKAAYLWNMNRLGPAVIQMSQAIRRMPSEDRATRLHFWTNLAVLCAESGNLELCSAALHEARSLAIPNLDIYQLITLDLAEATRLMAIKDTDEAISLLDKNCITFSKYGNVPGEWYSLEAKSEALAISGKNEEAKRLWTDVERQRLSRCTRLTPRVLARRARIMRMA